MAIWVWAGLWAIMHCSDCFWCGIYYVVVHVLVVGSNRLLGIMFCNAYLSGLS